MKLIKPILTGFIFFYYSFSVFTQEVIKKPLSVSIQYFTEDNKTVYLLVAAKAKILGRFKPIPEIKIQAFLGEESEENNIDSAITDANGVAIFYLPAKLKEKWESSGTHTFIATAQGNDTLDDGTEEITIIKSKLKIDTLVEDGIRKIKLIAQAMENDTWLPIKEIEIKPGLQRLGGMLKVTQEEIYTTDSTGSVTIDFLDSLLAGDSLGNIILMAKVDENEKYGNLSVTRKVNWGKPIFTENTFYTNRTLWSTGSRTPYWLLVIVYGMTIGIWGTIFSIFAKLYKIISLGRLR